MTGLELDDAIKWMEARWGDDKVWNMGADRVSADFRHLTPGAVMDALWAWYRGGQARAPRPGQLLAAANEHYTRRVRAGQDAPFDAGLCANGQHTFAHDPAWPDVVCVKCGESEGHNPHAAGTSCHTPKPKQEKMEVF